MKPRFKYYGYLFFGFDSEKDYQEVTDKVVRTRPGGTVYGQFLEVSRAYLPDRLGKHLERSSEALRKEGKL